LSKGDLLLRGREGRKKERKKVERRGEGEMEGRGKEKSGGEGPRLGSVWGHEWLISP